MTFQPVNNEYINFLLEHLSLDQSTNVFDSLDNLTQKPIDLRDVQFSQWLDKEGKLNGKALDAI